MASSSIGERIKWDLPQPCPRCDVSAGYEVSPLDMLSQRAKCRNCFRVWTVEPELTELGLSEAKALYIKHLK
jgi:transposase-like protein